MELSSDQYEVPSGAKLCSMMFRAWKFWPHTGAVLFTSIVLRSCIDEVTACDATRAPGPEILWCTQTLFLMCFDRMLSYQIAVS